MTTGAGNDIERATDLARKMVCEYGMSEARPLTFGKKEEQIFLGREIAQHRDFSEETAVQQVLKPDSGRGGPGFPEGSPSPA
jgi:cell division protease FtsH